MPSSTFPDCRIRAISSAATRKVTASTIATAVMPPIAAATPPSPEPTSRARLRIWPLSAFAATSSSSGTTRGRNACSAGAKKTSTTDSTASTTYTSQIRSVPDTSRSGSRPRQSRRLATTMVRLRSQRSTKTPATLPTRTCGTNDDSNVAADASVDPVRA